MSDEPFAVRLQRFGIGEYSKHWKTVHEDRRYRKPEMVEVPRTVSFPAEAKKRPRFTRDEMSASRREFVKTQLRFIRDNISDVKNETDLTVTSPLIEFGVDCSSLEDYILLKRKIATYYLDKSRANGWEEPIRVCLNPRCLNAAVPTFDYCVQHLVDDKRFGEQLFLKQCAYTSGGISCKVPCPPEIGYCKVHRERLKGGRR